MDSGFTTSPEEEREQPGSESGSVEGGLGQRCRPGLRGGGPMKITEVSQDGGA
ncbi:hypothetical protein DPMN_064347 [Dreissena polymorpha]|uniref:Uncharacterized protein n=1 Tax=Dreissena polymorpha TaxID=45954 RepID=A0A9D4CDA8_DREPO|nr:hypothetical protein DPMN_064347 [Dreissena polymorpha]